MRILGIVLALFVVLRGASTPAHAATSWNGYHWAHATEPDAIPVLSDLGPRWTSRLQNAAGAWSATGVVALQSASTSGVCELVPGAVRVCGQRAGRNGWLGQTDLWVGNDGHIKAARVVLNLTYLNSKRFGDATTRRHVLCHELGHAIGLDHHDGKSCMNPSAPFQNAAYAVPATDDRESLVSTYAHADVGSVTTPG